MNEQKLTRRQMVRILGRNVPLVLISTQLIPKTSFAQSVNRLVYRIRRATLLDIMNDPNIFFEFSTTRDERANVIGGRIEKVPVEVLGETDALNMWLDGAVIYALNGQKFDAGSDESIAAAFARMKKLVEAGTPLVVDLEIDGEMYQYEIRYR